MSSGLSTTNHTVVSAFHTALLRQGLVIFAIVLLLALVWSLLRVAHLRRESGATGRSWSQPEPAARRLLRISFGLLWVFDGILQAQAAMPLGMGPDVIQPAAASSPTWVQHLDNTLVKVWTYHPVPAASAAVWIQIGIGIWLLVGPRGNWSRLGGLSSVAWGLVVWVFGEAFGGIFAPGLTWVFGAPGAALFYCFAGALIALPESAWATPRLGRIVLRVMGVFFVGMAVLQALPSHGFWQGAPRAGTSAGALPSMVRSMAQTPQPHFLSSLLSRFASFVAGGAWEVNLFLVLALTAIGTTFLLARPRAVRVAVRAGLVLCIADWVLIEDFGFFGGTGTDPNSMIPMALVFVAGYLALTRPAPASVYQRVRTREWAWRAWGERLAASPSYALRSLAAAGALAVTLVGVVPMGVAATEPGASTILAQAVDGPPAGIDAPAANFTLLDQHGHTVSMRSLRGKALALTVLDPTCTSDCPVIAQELRDADGVLGAEARRVELVAVVGNPRFIAHEYVAAFDRQERLQHVHNWLYLTGSRSQLRHAWKAMGALVAYEPGGGMIDHSEYVEVIDPSGRVRYILDSDPGPSTSATQSSFTSTLSSALENALRSS